MKQDLKVEGLIGLNEYSKADEIEVKKESLKKPKAQGRNGRVSQYSLDVYNKHDQQGEDSDEVKLVDVNNSNRDGTTRRDPSKSLLQDQIRGAARKTRSYIKRSVRKELTNRFKEPFLAAQAESA